MLNKGDQLHRDGITTQGGSFEWPLEALDLSVVLLNVQETLKNVSDISLNSGRRQCAVLDGPLVF